MEGPFVPHHICTVTRGLQTASHGFPLFSFLPGHPDMTYLLLFVIIIVFLFSAISCVLCNNLTLFKHVDDDDDDAVGGSLEQFWLD